MHDAERTHQPSDVLMDAAISAAVGS